MIEIRESEISEHDEYQLFIDNALMSTVEVTGEPSFEGDTIWRIIISDHTAFERLALYRFSELPVGLDFLELRLQFEGSDLIDSISIDPNDGQYPLFEKFIDITFNFRCDLSLWKRPYSFAEYAKEFSEFYEATRFC